MLNTLGLRNSNLMVDYYVMGKEGNQEGKVGIKTVVPKDYEFRQYLSIKYWKDLFMEEGLGRLKNGRFIHNALT